MPQKISLVPGKLTARQAQLGIFVASLFLLFGLILGTVVLVETSFSSEPGLAIALSAFGLVWIAACVSMIIFYRRLLKASRTPGSESFGELLIENPPDGKSPDPTRAIEIRLEKIDDLRRQGVITEEEHSTQRTRILRDI
jgi:hypothetical protein